MKILFISSGNKKEGISPITKAQGESLKRKALEIDYFLIREKGFAGYFKNIFLLRNYVKSNNYDLFHAHYSLSGYIATIAGLNPLVVSLMGSDVKANNFRKYLIRLFKRFKWDSVIVKSKDLSNILRLQNINIIPNGVNLNAFYPMDKKEEQEKLRWSLKKKHILFAADPKREEKNFTLAQKALKIIADENIEMHTSINVPHNEMIHYFNASEVLLLTSNYEGSPNVIKEALACNLPIVSTSVGDVKHLIGATEGCFLCSFDQYDVAEKIKLALNFSEKTGKTTGRERLIGLGLDSETVANRIIDLYKKVLSHAQ